VRLRFQKCGHSYCVESSFSNDDSERLEDHFENRLEDFVPNMSKKNKLFKFIHRCHKCGEPNPYLSPIVLQSGPIFVAGSFRN
jgi:hypothetical protein